MERALWAWRLSSGVTSEELATARFLLAQRRMLSGRVLPAQSKKSLMDWREVRRMSSPASSFSSSGTVSSPGASEAKRRPIMNWRKPSSAESFKAPPKATSRIR